MYTRQKKFLGHLLPETCYSSTLSMQQSLGVTQLMYYWSYASALIKTSKKGRILDIGCQRRILQICLSQHLGLETWGLKCVGGTLFRVANIPKQITPLGVHFGGWLTSMSRSITCECPPQQFSYFWCQFVGIGWWITFT